MASAGFSAWTFQPKVNLEGAIFDEEDRVIGFELCDRCGCDDEPHSRDKPWLCESCAYILDPERDY